jgi:hypothetical protein
VGCRFLSSLRMFVPGTYLSAQDVVADVTVGVVRVANALRGPVRHQNVHTRRDGGDPRAQRITLQLVARSVLRSVCLPSPSSHQCLQQQRGTQKTTIHTEETPRRITQALPLRGTQSRLRPIAFQDRHVAGKSYQTRTNGINGSLQATQVVIPSRKIAHTRSL